MRVIAIRPEPSGAKNTIARFDVELSGGIRLFNLKLSNGGNGLRVFAPSAFGTAAATFTHPVAAALAEAANKKLGEIAHNAARTAE